MKNIAARTQGKQKPCAYCDRTFTKVEHLKRHQRSHTGERPFKCGKCGRRYARSDVLARHLQKHPAKLADRDGVCDDPESEHRSHSLDGHAQRKGDNIPVLSQDDDISVPGSISAPCQQNPPTQNHELPATLASDETAFFDHIRPDKDSSAYLNDQTLESRAAFPHSQSSMAHSAVEQASSSTTDTARTRLYSRMTAQDDQTRFEDQSLRNSYRQHPVDIGSPSIINDTPPVDNNSSIPQQPTASLLARQRTQSRTSTEQITSELQLTQTVGLTASHETNNHSPSGQLLQPHELQSNNCSPHSLLAGDVDQARCQIDVPTFGSEINVFDFDYETTPGVPELQMSPNIMEFMDFGSSVMEIALPSFDDRLHQEAHTKTPFSTGELQRLHKIWPKKRTVSAARLIQTLWHDTVQYEADNLFSEPLACDAHSISAQECPRTSKWNVDDNCRERLVREYYDIKVLDDQRLSNDVNLNTLSAPLHLEAEIHDVSPGSSQNEFASSEMLERSLDFFFRCFHPVMPFIHKATFDAKRTPSSLLFPMCLIGLSIMDPQGSKNFIRQRLMKMIQSCQADLTSKALGRCRPSQLILTLASTLLVLYLALDFVNELDECQVLMPCAQMLRIAEKQGIFAAYEGTDLISDMLEGRSDSEGLWKSWARVESVKRTILYLILMDSAYTRLMGTAGVIEIDKVEVILPCDMILFEARTAANFSQATNAGTPMTMPRMRMHNAHGPLPATLNDLSLQTLLGALQLQISAARHRLLAGKHSVLEAHSFVPAEVFAKDTSAMNISATLVDISSNYYDIIRDEIPLTALTWHNLCLTLTADLDGLELLSGREGGESSRTAFRDIATWSRSVGARRAVVHAAQIFRILSRSRISEKNLLMPELLLFSSALVLGLFLFVAPYVEESASSNAFEVLQEVDWSAVGSDGLITPPDASEPYKCSHSSVQNLNSCCAARHYIGHGGLIAFSGDIQYGGVTAARKILLDYAHLIDEVTGWQGSQCSQLLRALSEFLVVDYDQRRRECELGDSLCGK